MITINFQELLRKTKIFRQKKGKKQQREAISRDHLMYLVSDIENNKNFHFFHKQKIISHGFESKQK